jgi:hypothetical protein
MASFQPNIHPEGGKLNVSRNFELLSRLQSCGLRQETTKLPAEGISPPPPTEARSSKLLLSAYKTEPFHNLELILNMEAECSSETLGYA